MPEQLLEAVEAVVVFLKKYIEVVKAKNNAIISAIGEVEKHLGEEEEEWWTHSFITLEE